MALPTIISAEQLKTAASIAASARRRIHRIHITDEVRKKVEDLLRSRKNKNPEPGFFVKDVLWTPGMIRKRIENDDNAVKHALMRIYSYQTESEQQVQSTHETNRVGFGALDAKLLSDFAEQLKTKGWLSKKQMDITRKRMLKYSRQLFGYVADALFQVLNDKIGEKNVWDLLRYSDYREKIVQLAKEKIVDWDEIMPFLTPEQRHQHRGRSLTTKLGI